MTARNGMTVLISELRAMTKAGTAEYTDPVTSWTDEQLQSHLDRTMNYFVREELQIEPQYGYDAVLGGSAEYFDYYTKRRWVERLETGSGTTTAFRIENSAGSVVGTAAYAINYEQGRITFTADQRGTVYYLTGREYDLNRAAAEVWKERAAYESLRVDYDIDNHNIKASQKIKHAETMAEFYLRKSKPRSVLVGRSDTT